MCITYDQQKKRFLLERRVPLQLRAVTQEVLSLFLALSAALHHG